VNKKEGPNDQFSLCSGHIMFLYGKPSNIDQFKTISNDAHQIAKDF
jgi:hypothetical protein